VELKAHCADLGAAREIILRLGARPAGALVQTDTYFRVANGRLKLRRIEGQGDELIWYDRPDQAETRISRYHRLPVADASRLEQALAAALGIRGEVRKHREVWLWHNVRIHLDQVAELGAYLEFEAVLTPGETEAAAHDRLALLSRELSVGPSDTLAGSYADLLNL
jgi:adenylate cyclase, class 2